MLCQDIVERLEQHSPVCYAEEWDNVGLLAGRRTKKVQRILVALDAVDEVIEQAVACQADMLITHHPLIFSARKSVTEDDVIGKRLVTLIQNDISYYAMHTNFDVKGMAELSAEKLELKDVKVLEQTAVDEQGKPDGIGRYGMLPEVMQLKKLAEYVKERFELEHVTVCGDPSWEIKLAAISTGSGKSMVPCAIASGAQVLITGDIDYHTALDAKAEGLAVIDAGHYGTEKMFVPYLCEYLRETCPETEVMKANQSEPWQMM